MGVYPLGMKCSILVIPHDMQKSVMSKRIRQGVERSNPFGDLVGLTFTSIEKGYSQCMLEVDRKLLNPFGSLHGGATYTMADTGMGAALLSCIDDDEQCSTIEIKIVYFKSVKSGALTCDTKVIHRSNRFATLESEVTQQGCLVAKALGTWSIYKKKKD